jgi:DNA-binding NtrC family response regulator
VGKKVLIIDDEPTIRYALRRYFTRREWLADEAENGKEALEKLLAPQSPGDEYALIVSDVKMPGLSGGDLYDALEEKRPDLLNRVLFSTGDTTSAESAKLISKGRCPIIQKPFELATLDKHIQQIFEKTGGHREQDPAFIQP